VKSEVSRIVLAAWDQYRNVFSDWPRTEWFFAGSANRSAEMDLLVATAANRILGLVGYIALPMYLRLGFVHCRDIPDRNGLPYAIYALKLDPAV
jgi:hypothetical protein